MHFVVVMANCIDRINANAWTVGADHVVARYNIAENVGRHSTLEMDWDTPFFDLLSGYHV